MRDEHEMELVYFFGDPAGERGPIALESLGKLGTCERDAGEVGRSIALQRIAYRAVIGRELLDDFACSKGKRLMLALNTAHRFDGRPGGSLGNEVPGHHNERDGGNSQSQVPTNTDSNPAYPKLAYTKPEWGSGFGHKIVVARA
jgi:hypothetical protein